MTERTYLLVKYIRQLQKEGFLKGLFQGTELLPFIADDLEAMSEEIKSLEK